MNNSEISEILSSFAKLSELHGGNPFKIKSYQSAAFAIDKFDEELCTKNINEIESIQGIGKSIAGIIHQLCTHQTFPELENLIANTPKGVIEMMRIKGLGPKKIGFIWKELGIENVGELLYACKENRLAEAKGFGLKTQQNIIQQINFMLANAGKFYYYQAVQAASPLVQYLSNVLPFKISICGQLRRAVEVIEMIEILVGSTDTQKIHDALVQSSFINGIVVNNNFIEVDVASIPVKIYTCVEEEFAYNLMLRTGNNEHLKLIGLNEDFKTLKSENEIYAALNFKFIEPELREGMFESALKDKSIKLIEFADLKGVIHNHSKWSDGNATIEQMATFCIEKGWQYFGIADHSKSAYYANGLNEERILAQQKEIDDLNKKLSPFKIFKGIECDILNDGNLDYDNEILKTFDYVVASVHSNLKMDEHKAMQRLIKAIENPYTTILGHATARLLLVREGYPINHQKIIDACAANGVCIELNANPYRLDLDWRYIPYAIQKGVKISINPDAHDTEGLLDMQWGISVARKGMLQAADCLNALSCKEIEDYFINKKPM